VVVIIRFVVAAVTVPDLNLRLLVLLDAVCLSCSYSRGAWLPLLLTLGLRPSTRVLHLHPVFGSRCNTILRHLWCVLRKVQSGCLLAVA
jgi:hypothetical protein